MKRIILTTMAAIFLTAVAAVVNAQDTLERVDTVERETPLKRPDPNLPSSTQPRYSNPDVQYNNDPFVRIRTDEIPSSLRETLKDERYKGWQESPVYRDNRTSEFSIDIRSGDSLRTYRFDRHGKPLHRNHPQNRKRE